MSYAKKAWANDDDVTPADFNRIEQGIADNAEQINNLSKDGNLTLENGWRLTQGILKVKKIANMCFVDMEIVGGVGTQGTTVAVIIGDEYKPVSSRPARVFPEYGNGNYKAIILPSGVIAIRGGSDQWDGAKGNRKEVL